MQFVAEKAKDSKTFATLKETLTVFDPKEDAESWLLMFTTMVNQQLSESQAIMMLVQLGGERAKKKILNANARYRARTDGVSFTFKDALYIFWDEYVNVSSDIDRWKKFLEIRPPRQAQPTQISKLVEEIQKIGDALPLRYQIQHFVAKLADDSSDPLMAQVQMSVITHLGSLSHLPGLQELGDFAREQLTALRISQTSNAADATGRLPASGKQRFKNRHGGPPKPINKPSVYTRIQRVAPTDTSSTAGHDSHASWNSKKDKFKKKSANGMTCYNCRKKGHRASECPEPAQVQKETKNDRE